MELIRLVKHHSNALLKVENVEQACTNTASRQWWCRRCVSYDWQQGSPVHLDMTAQNGPHAVQDQWNVLPTNLWTTIVCFPWSCWRRAMLANAEMHNLVFELDNDRANYNPIDWRQNHKIKRRYRIGKFFGIFMWKLCSCTLARRGVYQKRSNRTCASEAQTNNSLKTYSKNCLRHVR